MTVAQDQDKPEIPVKVLFKAFKYITVNAETREEAHRLAYNSFMDMGETEILDGSQVEDFFVETTIHGDDGSDMLHG
jgi:hypothetical protein